MGHILLITLFFFIFFLLIILIILLFFFFLAIFVRVLVIPVFLQQRVEIVHVEDDIFIQGAVSVHFRGHDQHGFIPHIRMLQGLLELQGSRAQGVE